VAETYLPRLTDGTVRELFAELPALMLVGPRATGKTTSARQLAQTVVRLDRPPEAAAFLADPDAALKASAEPVVLDEWQAVPSVLGAVKRAVDEDFRPGRFVLTGSVRANLDAETWPGTGRVIPVPIYGLTQRELAGRITGPTFVDRVADGELSALSPADPTPDLPGYVDLALAGGYPEPVLRLSEAGRQAWLDGYLEQLLTRDAATLTARRPLHLRRYFEALALNTAGVVEHKTLYDAARIDRHTAVSYDALLSGLFVVEALPAWYTNRLSRLIKTPKRYVVDPSLVAAALRADRAAVLRDGDLLGRILDTFVAAQLRPELVLSSSRPRLHHLRDKSGRHEIDLLAELGGHRVVGLEVRASAAPTRADARHLAWLRDELDDRFLHGAVLHTGPRAFVLDERIFALPISAIWGTTTS
jgi:predicted AAA+ superfamily ATPase